MWALRRLSCHDNERYWCPDRRPGPVKGDVFRLIQVKLKYNIILKVHRILVEIKAVSSHWSLSRDSSSGSDFLLYKNICKVGIGRQSVRSWNDPTQILIGGAINSTAPRDNYCFPLALLTDAILNKYYLNVNENKLELIMFWFNWIFNLV